MKKIHRNIGIAVAAFVVLLLVLPLLINVNSFRPKIESELSTALGRKVEVGDLGLSILGGKVSAANIRIADDPAFSKSPFLTAKSLNIGVELMPLTFSKQLNITGFTLDEPSIALLSGLGSKLSVLSAFSGKAASSRDTTIQNASAGSRVAPEGTKLDSTNVTVPSLGVLTGAGTVSPSGALNFKMVAELSGGTGERAVQRSGRREERSGGGIPFAIEGTTADPKFVPDVKSIAGGAAKQAISGKVSPQGEKASKGLGGALKKRR